MLPGVREGGVDSEVAILWELCYLLERFDKLLGLTKNDSFGQRRSGRLGRSIEGFWSLRTGVVGDVMFTAPQKRFTILLCLSDLSVVFEVWKTAFL